MSMELWINLLPSWLPSSQEIVSEGEKKWKGEVRSSQQGWSVGQGQAVASGVPFSLASNQAPSSIV